MLDTAERLPWAGHSARHALGEMYELIRRHKTTLVLWRLMSSYISP